jgi:hypothetical protein
MRRQPIRLLLLACVLGATAFSLEAPRESAAGGSRARSASMPVDYLLADIARYRRETWRWQRLMGVRRTRAARVRRHRSPAYRRWVRNVWRKRAVKHRRKAHRPPHRHAWRCIQRYEGRWNDPNPPYYGGLQMDMAFQRMYGSDLLRRKGTADRWTPVEQMWVAERAYRAGRGFYPWPNTARYCGLI